MVTTSYVSPAMMELDEQCREAGITVMNEIGLDPGLDHLCKYLCHGFKQTDADKKKTLSRPFTRFTLLAARLPVSFPSVEGSSDQSHFI